jgi:hypothetical protein
MMTAETGSSVPQQELANISLDDSTPSKPSELLYSNKAMSLSSFAPKSLSLMMRKRPSFATSLGTRGFAAATSSSQMLKPVLKTTAFDAEDYGYGFAEPSRRSPSPNGEEELRPAKRRKFERRNSKTPAMLLQAMQEALDLDLLDVSDDETDEMKARPESEHKDSDGDDSEEDNWDKGLVIAQELVKQLRERRRGVDRTL